MAKLGVHQIRDLARKIVRRHPGGIRQSQLALEILRDHPETSRNTISGSTWDLATRYPTEITKPSRGLFVPADAASGSTVPTPKIAPSLKEEHFYGPFAEWLKQDLDEVTVASALGGAGLKAKWGTPDVVGVYKPLAADLIKFPLEVVSAEIKIDPTQPVVAFGQAIAYRLFSTKSYVVMPSSMNAEDSSRLESLGQLFGVGVVTFDLDKDSPNFQIRVRAQRFSPDMFYVNEFAERLRQHDPSVFETLFG